MAYVDNIDVGGTNYDIAAKQLSTDNHIDGVSFNGTTDIIHYGVSSTAAGTATKTVSIADFKLAAGSGVKVKFTNANTADNPKLNVTSTGAKSIMVDGTTAAAGGSWKAGEVVEFLYDGTNYMIQGVTSGALNEAVDQINTDMQGYLPLDGYSEEATVGNAEQLVSTVLTNDKVPYNFRTSGGASDIGDREYDTVTGGTVVWNQLIQNGNFASTTGWSAQNGTISAAGGVGSVIVADSTSRTFLKWENMKLPLKHKFFVGYSIRFSEDSSNAVFRLFDVTAYTTVAQKPNIQLAANTWTNFQTIVAPTHENATDSIQFGIFPTFSATPTTGATYDVKNVMFIDLTALFGYAVADYVYSLEQSNTGDGVAWISRLFPKINGGYYAYNAGEIMSVNTSAHITTGFNAFNPATGTAKLVGGMQYQITGTYTALSFTDAGGNAETVTPDSGGYFTPASNGTLTVTGGDSTTTCVHLVWDGEMDGEWEEYVEHSYPLDSSLTLKGVPLLDPNSRLYYDGDVYASNGTVTTNYSIIAGSSMGKGAITAVYTANGYTRFFLYSSAKGIGSMVCDKAPYDARAGAYTAMDYACVARGDMTAYPSSWIMVMPESEVGTTVDTIYNYLQTSGVQFMYKLAAPTTSSAAEYQNLQIVNDWGTEEYTDYAYSQGTRDVQIPVGHNTNYTANLRAKLETAPDSPSADGDYIVRQIGGQNVYVPLVFPSDVFPNPPSADGTYTLHATVADGEVTYSWS